MATTQSATVGEVVVTRDVDEGGIELTVHCAALPTPRVYAYPLTDTLSQFFRELAVDVALQPDAVELVATSGSTMSKGMAHSFAWKPGRQLRIGQALLRLSFVEAGVDSDSPLLRRPTSSKLPTISSDRAPMKYVVVTGGVVSGLGKGVTASSLGVLLKQAGYRVTSIKIDPYLNVDAGLMSPFEHGEVFVLDDGGEADLDLGNYERFVNLSLTRDHNITTGKIYKSCIERERRGDYLGKTVQVVPHVTDCIMEWIERVAHLPTDGAEGPPDCCVIELGGTVGDIESSPFVEALRQFQFRVGRENMCFFHVSLVPIIGVVGEEKTKPTQHSVQQLRAAGLTPDFLVCRSGAPLSSATKRKLALFCHVPPEHCLGVHDVSNIYRVPLLLNHQGTTKRLLSRLDLIPRVGSIEKYLAAEWVSLAELVDSLTIPVCIAVVGKYTGLSDAYLSVNKSLLHASFAVERKLRIEWIDSSHLDEAAKATDRAAYDLAWTALASAHGILVPGGFGIRAVEGKIAAARYARENKKPFLGICLGFQLAVIEFARNVLNIPTAHSTELDESCPTPLVIFMPEGSRTQMGGTMRLGSRRTMLKSPKCATAKLYNGATAFDERHRHRYEVNPDYVQQLESAGLEFVGRDTTGERMEVFEIADHPYYIGCQFHPEFKSRPLKPSPLFLGLLQAAAKASTAAL